MSRNQAKGDHVCGASPKNQARIVLTANTAWNLWNFRAPLVRALSSKGFELFVVAPRDDSVPELETLGCKFVPILIDPKGINPFVDALFAWRMHKAIGELRPDAVLSFTIKNNIYGALAARSLGVPFIPSITGLGTAFLSYSLLRSVAQQLYRRAFSRLPIVFFQNADDRALFIEHKLVREEQGHLVPGSGIDLDHFAALPPPALAEPVIFLMIARLLRDKGVEEYVNAARLVRRRHPNVRFQLMGSADAANRTAVSIETVRSWEVSHGIEYLGTSADVRREIADAHCVVLPSYREGAPRTLIEAAAMARPLIATDVPGCRAVVDDRKNGFLCQPRSATSLADACFRFLDLDQDERTAMGRKGRAKMASEYDQKLVNQAYFDALTSVLSNENCGLAEMLPGQDR